jgi:hypothetical protein
MEGGSLQRLVLEYLSCQLQIPYYKTVFTSTCVGLKLSKDWLEISQMRIVIALLYMDEYFLKR